MPSITFQVNGLPPKKDGANTMWNKDSEAERLIALRKAAFAKLGGRGVFTKNIEIAIRLHIGQEYNIKSRSGDLGNFICGVFDGLMTANPRAKLHCSFESHENSHIHPREFRVIEDDFNIMKIDAEKIVAGDTCRYEIKIIGEVDDCLS